MSSAAPTYELIVPQGGNLIRTFVWKDSSGNPIDLTNYTAKMQIRTIPSATGTIMDVSSTATTLNITGTAGKITLNLPATDTAAMTFNNAVFDLEVTATTAQVTRLIQGCVILDKEVTR